MLELFNGKSNHSIQVWVRKVFRCLLLHCRTARGHWTQECRMSDRLSSLSTPRSSGKIFSRQENKQRWSGHSAVCEPGQSHRWAGGPLPFSSPPALPGQQTLIMTGGREGEVSHRPGQHKTGNWELCREQTETWVQHWPLRTCYSFHDNS